jgi:hypothetical protein
MGCSCVENGGLPGASSGEPLLCISAALGVSAMASTNNRLTAVDLPASRGSTGSHPSSSGSPGAVKAAAVVSRFAI